MDEVLYLHDESLRRFGGLEGVGNPGLIDSALGASQNAYWYGHGDLVELCSRVVRETKRRGLRPVVERTAMRDGEETVDAPTL